MQRIQAIETTYARVRFRSRLEARWAVFFDEIGMPWQYEYEAFVFDHIIGEDMDGQPLHGNKGQLQYTPDFWLPTFRYRRGNSPGAWFEVKPNSDYDDKPLSFAFAQLLPVFVAKGRLLDEDIDFMQFEDGWDTGYKWGRCTFCGEWTIHFDRRAGRHCGGDRDFADDDDARYMLASGDIHRFWDPK